MHGCLMMCMLASSKLGWILLKVACLWQQVPSGLVCCRMAQAFITEEFFDAIAAGKDILSHGHANTILAQVPILS